MIPKNSVTIFYYHILMLIVFMSQDTPVYRSFCSEEPVLFCVYISLLFIALGSYSECFRDPGKEISTEDNGMPYCNICQGHTPVRGSHCSKCNQCISRRHFHCDWIHTCVGRNNSLSFLGFISSEALFLGLALFLSIRSILSVDLLSVWNYRHVLVLIILPATVYGFLQSSIYLVQFTHIIISNAVVLESKGIFGFQYVTFLKRNLNVYELAMLDNIHEFLFMGSENTKWVLPDTDKAKAYKKEIELHHYQKIDEANLPL